MRNTKLMAVGCVLVLAAAPAFAGDMDKDHKDPSMSVMGKQFGDLDANRDNKISKQELTEKGISLADFDQADANSDGTLDQEEFAALSEE